MPSNAERDEREVSGSLATEVIEPAKVLEEVKEVEPVKEEVVVKKKRTRKKKIEDTK